MKLYYDDSKDPDSEDRVWCLASDEMILREAFEILIRNKLIVDKMHQYGTVKVELEKRR